MLNLVPEVNISRVEGLKSSKSGDIKYLTFHMTWQEHVIEGSREVIGESLIVISNPSSLVTTHIVV